MDITELKAIIDANIFENTSQAITGDALNDVLNLIADSLGEYVPVADIFDEAGTIRSSLLPSYVDDVLEFSTRDAFPAVGEGGKIYLATDTNLSYRWGGSEYVIIAQSLALGETSSTAYRGDRGKIAYDHSQTSHRLSIAGLEVSALGGSIDSEALASALSIPELRTAVAAHIGDGIIHITADERTAWNKVASLFGVDENNDIYVKNGKGFYTEGFISAGGKSESSSGGGSADYTQWGWDDIIQLTSDPGLGNLASAWALKQEYDSRQSALSVLSQGLSSIRLLIPSSASESNQLADKEFVNSSIASNTATFRGTFEGVSYLPSGAKLNDYAFVIATDASGNPEYNRYKYTASGWVFEYTLNNSSFTAEQWSAITSGITANLVSLYSGHIANQSNPHAVTKAQIGLGDVENIKLSSWAGSTSITTLGAVTTGEWKASKIANDYLVNSSIRIGSTTVALGGAIEALSGIASISLKGNNDAKLVYDNGAWHLSGNLLVDGYITAGGVGSSSGGGGIDSAAMWALLGDATGEQINKTHISAALEGYQTIIPDLATIRNNASNGNTAYGWGNHRGLYLRWAGSVADAVAQAWGTLTPANGYSTASHASTSDGGDIVWAYKDGKISNQLDGWFYQNEGQYRCLDTSDLNYSNIVSALGYTPYNASNPNGYISGISKAMVEGVLTGNITSHTHSFASLTSKPTTISGYGITDALTTANFNTYAPTLTGAGASGTWGINISGNAATATQLQTARTIWGQSFNGTANVSGDMTGVGSITASGAIKASGVGIGTELIEHKLDVGGFKAGLEWVASFKNKYHSQDGAQSVGIRLELGSYGEANIKYAGIVGVSEGEWEAATGIAFYTREFSYDSSVYPTEKVRITGSGNVGIGTTSPSEKLHVIGNILATGAITAGTASDSRLKSNIATLVNASSVLRQLRGVGFDWNALATDKSSYFKGHDVGLIAQEVEPLIPSAIGTIWGEYKRLDYTKITPYLVEGWKEHDNEIDRLRARVSELESEVNKLRQYVN